jgi:FAD:protein FMN transferase
MMVLIVVLPFLFALTGCRDESPVYNLHFNAFAGPVDLGIVGVKRVEAERASRLLEQDFEFMRQAWGAPGAAPLERVNNLLAGGKPFAAPPCILPLVRRSQELAIASGNLFNPAIGKLIDLWGLQSSEPERRQVPPDPAKIAALIRARPLMGDIQIDGILMQSLNANLKLDFGFIGKGYGIDLAVDHLRELGIHNALVSVSGDLRAIGTRGGQPWPVALRNPVGGGVLAILQVSGDESVFTSGDYQRNFIHKGKTYHHVIDPRTGWPASGARLVTVIHDDATAAAAAATAVMIAGADLWHATAKAMGVRSVLLIDPMGRIHMDPSMARRIEILDRNAEIIPGPSLSGGDAGALPGP